MAVPCLVKEVGAKMKNRYREWCKCKEAPNPAQQRGKNFYMRFGAVWESQRRCACNVVKQNDMGQLHAVDIVA